MAYRDGVLARDILDNHLAEPLSDEAQAELKLIIAIEEKLLCK